MENRIRLANVGDVPAMVDLSEAHRLALQEYQPLFWRKAENSQALQSLYFEKLMNDEAVIKLVAEVDTNIDGFIIAMPIAVPPVYNPNGNTYLIDDYCVQHISAWSTVGKALLKAAIEQVKLRTTSQIIVVCPHFLQEKRSVLQSEGLTVASEWYVRQI